MGPSLAGHYLDPRPTRLDLVNTTLSPVRSMHFFEAPPRMIAQDNLDSEPLLLSQEEEQFVDWGVVVIETDCEGQSSTEDNDGDEGDDDADADDGTRHDDGTTEDKPSVASRAILIFVAFLYATFSISLRWVYSLPVAPGPSEWTSVRGWVSLVCFLPLLMRRRNRRRRRSQQQQYSSSPSPQPPPSVTESAGTRTRPTVGEATTAVVPSPSVWMAAAELAVWNFLSQASYNIGLLTTPSARASFLSQTCVIMTPLIAMAVGDDVGTLVWVGCLAALVGLGFLSSSTPGGGDAAGGGVPDDGGGGIDLSYIGADAATSSSSSSSMAQHVGLGMGDCMILLASMCWSFCIFRTSSFGGRFGGVQLQGIKNFLLAILYTAWWLIDNLCHSAEQEEEETHPPRRWFSMAWTNPMVVSIVAYSALFPGTIADLLQQYAQASVPASESTVLLSMEPIFTASLGFLLLGERLSWQEWCGGGFLILGSLVSSL
jgi:drug/metabolite transporter (DMT)-like permease